MKKIKITLLATVVSILFSSQAFSAPRIICVENDGNSLKIRKQQACINNGGTTMDLAYLASRDKILCYANISAEANPPTVRSFGGARTTNVEVTRASEGSYRVTCTGTYPGLSSSDDLTISISATDSDARDSVSGNTDLAFTTNETTIEFFVFGFTNSTDPSEAKDTDFSVIVLGDL
jgi:hypothetical protein